MFRERRFYSNVRGLVRGHLGAALVLGLIALGLARQPSSDGVVLGMVLAITFAVFCIVFSVVFLVARRIWPTELGPEGLHGYNSMGRYSDVRWDQIESVTEEWTYLWIRPRGGVDRITVPTWLEGFPDFAAYVLVHAPPENPLSVSLRGRGGVSR